jgi:DNA primase
LPTGHDPDSYVRERGVNYFKQTLSHAKSIIKFKIDTLSQKLDVSATPGKTQLINSLLESIIRIKDSIKQNLALKEVAEYFRLDERALMEQLHHIKKNERNRPVIVDKLDSPKKATTVKQKSRYESAEEDLVRLVMEDINWLPITVKHLQLDEMADTEIRGIFSIMYNLYQQHEQINPHMILEHITDPKISARMAELMTTQYEATADNKRKLFEDCLVKLKIRKYENIISNLKTEIKIAEEKGIDVTDYQKRYLQYQATIKAIESKEFLKE